jgi:hypothetical protein
MEANQETTMADLRKEVATLLRDTLHGKTVDMMQTVKPRLPHMLGYTEIGEVFDPNELDGTLLDSRHDFWDDYYETVNTRNKARNEVVTAIETLKEDGKFRMTYPYGEEGGIIYVEVDDPNQYRLQDTPEEQYIITCQECSHTLSARPSLTLYNGYCHLKVSAECEECGFSGQYSRKLIRE